MNTERLRSRLDSGLMNTEVLLGRAKLLDRSSREVPAFNDSRYFPFYYYLAAEVGPNPIRVVQIGAKLGLIGACFLQGYKSTCEWQSMEPVIDGVRPPSALINSNLKLFSQHNAGFFLFHDNNLKMAEQGDPDWKVDVALLSEKYDPERVKGYLDFFWSYLQTEGLLVVDYISDDATGNVFREFCRVKNREPQYFNTRYGVGIILR